MRFSNVILEGVDCSGKTKLYYEIHKQTNFAYNIQDRGSLSMYVHSVFYDRDDKHHWFTKIMEELKRLDTLYVVLLPKIETILERLNKRGDEFQNEETVQQLYKIFNDTVRFGFGRDLPNILIIEDQELEEKATMVKQRLNDLELARGGDLIKALVVSSGRNELVDVSCTTDVRKEGYDPCALDFPPEKEYYAGITAKVTEKIQKEFLGLNSVKMPQKHDSRRFIYTDESCISMIHFLWRDNALNVSATLRSSNVAKTLWADYEYLKYLCDRVSKEMQVKDCPIQLQLQIRSAHIVP